MTVSISLQTFRVLALLKACSKGVLIGIFAGVRGWGNGKAKRSWFVAVLGMTLSIGSG